MATKEGAIVGEKHVTTAICGRMRIVNRCKEGHVAIVYQCECDKYGLVAVKIAREGKASWNSVSREKSRESRMNAFDIPCCKILEEGDGFVVKPWISGFRGDSWMKEWAKSDFDEQNSGMVPFVNLVRLFCAASRQRAYVRNLKSMNMIWETRDGSLSSGRWVIVDSGGIEEMSKTCMGRYKETFLERWLPHRIKQGCVNRLKQMFDVLAEKFMSIEMTTDEKKKDVGVLTPSFLTVNKSQTLEKSKAEHPTQINSLKKVYAIPFAFSDMKSKENETSRKKLEATCSTSNLSLTTSSEPSSTQAISTSTTHVLPTRHELDTFQNLINATAISSARNKHNEMVRPGQGRIFRQNETKRSRKSLERIRSSFCVL